ncbi:MAG: ABC transporter permease, partial [Chloroflexota bacterium]|nr:ABC transporter permease [Chloroflexota bacterium]
VLLLAATALGEEFPMFPHIVSRVVSTIILLVALVFFVALAIDLGRGGGLQTWPSSISSAAGFTVDYLVNLTHGDMGVIAPPYPRSPTSSVSAELARALPRSLGLLAVAMALAVLVGLPLGIGAGLRRKTRFSGLLVFLSVLGVSTPSYFAAMLLIWLGVWLYRTTGADFIPLHGFGWDAHLILPALVLAARPAANVMRLGYNALVEVLDADFVRTAHAKGLGPWLVLFRHVLRAAGVPLLTTVAVSLRFSLAVLPIVEYIFNWSGVGEELLTAIQLQDTTTVIGMVLPLAFLFVIVNIFLEILYRIVDPRLRTKEAGAV